MSNVIVPLYYNGQKVLTTRQLATQYCCSRQVIDGAFRRHQDNFEKGFDYFYLEKEALQNFKNKLSRKLKLLAGGNEFCSPFSNYSSVLYLWTESGAMKLSKFIGTDEAKLIYSSLKFGYFQKAEQTYLPLQNSAPSNNFEVVDRLIKIAELTADKNFKETLLKRAAEII